MLSRFRVNKFYFEILQIVVKNIPAGNKLFMLTKRLSPATSCSDTAGCFLCRFRDRAYLYCITSLRKQWYKFENFEEANNVIDLSSLCLNL